MQSLSLAICLLLLLLLLGPLASASASEQALELSSISEAVKTHSKLFVLFAQRQTGDYI
jgi:hypothetical protein